MINVNSYDMSERYRKRQFFLLSCSVGMIPALVFSIINYFEKDILEFIITLFLGLLFLSGAIGIFKFNADRLVYCVGLNLMSIALLTLVSIGAGEMTILFWFFFMPLHLFFFLKRTDAIISVSFLLFMAAILLFFPSWFGTYDYGLKMSFRFLISITLLTIIGYGIEASRLRFSTILKKSNSELNSHKKQLEEALAEVKVLYGMLPICVRCKKIRDDNGYWNPLESYIESHSAASFSHGICPECSDDLYGKQQWYIKMKK